MKTSIPVTDAGSSNARGPHARPVRDARGTRRRPAPTIHSAVSGEAAPLALELRRIPLDPDPEHVPVAVLRQQAVELDAGEDEQARGRRGLAPVPVIGERDDVVAGAPVVLRDARGDSSPSEFVECVWSAARSHSPSALHGDIHGRDPIARLAGDRRTIAGRTRPEGEPWKISRSRSTSSFARLEEEKIGRRRLLKRGLAAGGRPHRHRAARSRARRAAEGARGPADPRNARRTWPQLVAAAKKEGQLNVIALPPDWANYGEIISTFSKKYGIPITSDNPNGSSSEENQAIVSLKGDPRAPDVVDVNPTFAVAGTVAGLYARYYVSNYATVPRAMKDTRGLWTGDYYGSITIGYNANLVKTPPKSFADLLKPIYKNQVALNGSPLKSGSAIAGVFAAALANGGSLSNVGPGVDWFAKARSAGNFIPVQTTPQTVASGQTPISIDWDYNNFAYVKEFPSANWKVVIPSDGQYAGYYCQAVNATAPHPWAARLWQEFIYSDQGQILYLKGHAHPARFADLVARKAIPKSVTACAPGRLAQRQGSEVREPRPAGEGEGGHQHRVAGEARLELAPGNASRNRRTSSGRAQRPAGDPRSPGSASCRSSPTPRCS